MGFLVNQHGFIIRPFHLSYGSKRLFVHAGERRRIVKDSGDRSSHGSFVFLLVSHQNIGADSRFLVGRPR